MVTGSWRYSRRAAFQMTRELTARTSHGDLAVTWAPYARCMNHQIHQGERTAERLAASKTAPLWGEEEARSLLADAERWAHQWAIDSADEHAALEAPTDHRSDVLIGLVVLVLLSVIFFIGLTRI